MDQSQAEAFQEYLSRPTEPRPPRAEARRTGDQPPLGQGFNRRGALDAADGIDVADRDRLA